MKFRLTVFFFLFYGLVFSQNKKTSLRYEDTFFVEILTALEKEYSVTFVYNATDFAQQRVSLYVENPNLSKVIAAIEANYRIQFTKIDNTYYSIVLSDNIAVCGYLKDAVDGSPIEGASIIIKNTTKGTESDLKGYYKVGNLSSSDTLQISYLGFKPLEIPVNIIESQNCPTYTLFSENLRLNEVIIQDYLSSGVVKTQDGAIKFKPHNLDILAGLSEPDVLQNIQLLPGIESPAENATGLFIRGGSPDQNLLLWNGVKMYNADHFFGMLSAFNPYITDNIRIYRSGAKPFYGDRISGVIDIQTQRKIPKKIRGGVGLNMTHGDAYLHMPIGKKTAVLISARRSISDFLVTPTFNNFANSVFQNTSITNNQAEFDAETINDNGRFYFSDITFSLNSSLSEKDKLSINSIFTKNQLDYMLNVEGFEQPSVDSLRISNRGVSINWNRKWNEKFSSRTEAYYSNYDFMYQGVNPFLVETLETTKSNKITELGLKLHTELKLNKSFTLSNGYQFFVNRVAYSLINLDYNQEEDQTNPTHSLYSGINYTRSNWYIDFSLRTEYYTLLQQILLEPRIFAEYSINDYSRVRASAELRNQSISQILEFASLDFGLENQVWALADDQDNLLLQSDQLSIGFSHNRNGWKFDMDIYYKNIIGFTSLTRSFAPADLDTEFSEGMSTIIGVDFLLKKRIDNYSTWIGYTFSNNTFRFDDINDGNAFRGNHNIRHSMTWSHAYTLDQFQFSLGWKFRTGIPFTNALGIVENNEDIFINYEAINANTLPNYHRLDISVLYNFTWFKGSSNFKGKIGLSLLNLYNRRNLLNRSFSIFEETDQQNNINRELRTINRQSLGFTPNLFFRVDF
jgi:hypothetical protein